MHAAESCRLYYISSVVFPSYAVEHLRPCLQPISRAIFLVREDSVALNGNQAVRLAHALRDLRESRWPDQVLTQAQLAKALSSDGRVAAATLSSWESATSPKTPAEQRISAYARFFCT